MPTEADKCFEESLRGGKVVKEKLEALIHSSHHTQPNSISVNFIFLGETVWFSCLSITVTSPPIAGGKNMILKFL